MFRLETRFLKLSSLVAPETLKIRHVCMSIFLTDHHTNMINIIFIENELAKFFFIYGDLQKIKKGEEKTHIYDIL